MVTEVNLYVNITNFLENNGLKVFFTSPDKVTFEFSDAKVSEEYENFNKLMKDGELTSDLKLRDEIFKKAWNGLELMQKEYYPKLQIILTALNSFYEERDTSLDYMILFDNNDLTTLSLGFNPLYKQLASDKDLFSKSIINEIKDFDSFIKG